MKLSGEDLPRHLAKGLAPLYVIHGEALLLVYRGGGFHSCGGTRGRL